MDPLARLVYRSNLLGSDLRITNTGGGNTSSKWMEKDPLTGEPVETLWVKGSGGDLRTARRENFASLYLEKLRGLKGLYQKLDGRGPKTPAEDRMVELYAHCTFNLNPRAASIDTPLHAFVPYAHVDHMHPHAVLSIAAAKHARELTAKVYGQAVLWTPWQRPGFELGLTLQHLCVEHPDAQGVVLGQHGLINWAQDGQACYALTLALIEKAAAYIEAHDQGSQTFGGARCAALEAQARRAALVELLPWLRGQLSGQKRMVATVRDDAGLLRFVNSAEAPRLSALGTSCPDHFLRTKIKPLYVDWNPQQENIAALKAKLGAGLEQYRADYAAYYQACKRPASPAMRDPNPTVILIPGLGLLAWGKDKSESRVTAEFYHCAVEVMRGAEALDEYVALPAQEAFDIEYWQLEEAKLRRMPPEKELARQVIAVIGAGSGIGKEVAQRVAQEGAHVVCVDVNAEAAQATARELAAQQGTGIGVAGTGVSACGPALGLTANITDRASVRNLLEELVLAYGGLDGLALTAGVFVSPDPSGHIPDEQWALTFSVNVTGAYLVCDEAARLFRRQGLPVSVVLTTSANGVVAKKGSVAYDTSKAAANHLVREMAIELAPLARVNGVAPATVVKGSAMFPRARVVASLAKYQLPWAEEESTEALRGRLADFYAQRTLTKQAIEPRDQAEAIFLLLSGRLAKTTGQILAVDGGLSEAFLR